MPEGYDSIVCTYVGFNRRSEKVSGNNEINFRLSASSGIISLKVDTVYSKSNRQPTTFDEPSAATSDSRYFETVEIEASYPGGEKALKTYLANHIVYPEAEVGNGVKGEVEIGFYVSDDGKSSDIMIIKGVNNVANKLVTDAVQSIPKWIPAIQNGLPVRQFKRINVSFDISRK